MADSADPHIPITFRRRQLGYEDLVRRRRRRTEVRWPKDLARVREVLPPFLQVASPPAAARRGCWVVAAQTPKTTVGFAWTVPFSDEEVTIEEIGVLPSHQGRGVGSELVRRTACWMLDLDYEFMSIYPISQKGYLIKLGFQPVPEVPTTLRASTHLVSSLAR